MSSFCIFFQQNISLYAIFHDQAFNDTLTNEIVSFENWPWKIREPKYTPYCSASTRAITGINWQVLGLTVDSRKTGRLTLVRIG